MNCLYSGQWQHQDSPFCLETNEIQSVGALSYKHERKSLLCVFAFDSIVINQPTTQTPIIHIHIRRSEMQRNFFRRRI